VWPKVKVDGHVDEILDLLSGGASAEKPSAVREPVKKKSAAKKAAPAKKVVAKKAAPAKKAVAKKATTRRQ